MSGFRPAADATAGPSPPPLRADPRPADAYASQYCEENAYLLAKAHTEATSAAGPAVGIFISNPRREVYVWAQRAAPPTEPVVWDYHVVFARQEGGRWLVYDPDTRLQPWPCPLDRYIEEAFHSRPADASFEVRFRVVSAAAFVVGFASDRSHMLDAGGAYMAPVPPWPPVGSGEHNLDEWLDVGAETPNEEGLGGARGVVAVGPQALWRAVQRHSIRVR